MLATRFPVGLKASGGWGDTAITLPIRDMTDAFTGRRSHGGVVPVGDVLDNYPVALLLAE